MWGGVVPIADRLERRIDELLDASLSIHTFGAIARTIEATGVTFEGARLGVSLFPTVLDGQTADAIQDAATVLRLVLCRVIQRFRAEHCARKLDGPFHQMFAPYEPWWDAITDERRQLPEIGLMRYDLAGRPGELRVLEPNTACPGGTVVCTRARHAWLATELARTVLGDVKFRTYPLDVDGEFVRFLAETAASVGASHRVEPNIGVLTDRGSLSFEIELWQEQFARLSTSGAASGRLVTADVREVVVHDGTAYVHDVPLALVHNKLNPIELDPRDRELAGWFAASAAPATEFVNSLGALYLTEAKRVLACISARPFQDALELDAVQREIVDRWVAPTRVLGDIDDAPWITADQVARDRRTLVLKPDALSRGQGVHIGHQCDDTEWRGRIAETATLYGVAQREAEVVAARTVDVDASSGQLLRGEEFLGIEAYMFGENVAGFSSRANRTRVCNVGNGGRLRPLLVIDP